MTRDVAAASAVPRRAGLRDRITRILHWDLNVRDLDRSIAFYESLTSFRAAAPVLDDAGVLLGTRAGRCRTALLVNETPGAPVPRLNLVEWLDPRPVGTPHDSIGAIGFTRVVMHVADLDATRARAEALGIEPVAPTTGDDFRFVLGSRGSTAYRVWACEDPDGVVVEFIESPRPKLSTIAQGTAALERDRGFYRDVLGLDLVDTVATPGPVPNVYLRGGAPVEFRGEFFRVHGVEAGYLDRLEHADPAVRRPPHGPAHHVGVIRCAFEVDDLDAAESTLRAARARGVPVGIDHPPAEFAFSAPLGRRRILTFRDPEGVGYQLVERADEQTEL